MGGENIPTSDIGLVLSGMLLSFIMVLLKDVVFPLIRPKAVEPERREAFGRRELDNDVLDALEGAMLQRMNGHYVRKDLFLSKISHLEANYEVLRKRTERIGNRGHRLKGRVDRYIGKSDHDGEDNDDDDT